MQMIQATMEDGDGRTIGRMMFPAGSVPNIGDRLTYIDDKNIIRQRDVVRGRHFVQSVSEPGVALKLYVMTESEILEEAASRTD